jgi:hypothetical protein
MRRTAVPFAHTLKRSGRQCLRTCRNWEILSSNSVESVARICSPQSGSAASLEIYATDPDQRRAGRGEAGLEVCLAGSVRTDPEGPI